MLFKISNPRRAEIVIASGMYSADEVRTITGADAVIPGGLYDMKSMLPCCHLRVKGIDYASDQYEYIGYGWNSGNARIKPLSSKNKVTVDNFICCSMMINGGKALDMIYNPDQGGKRGNTAFGLLADGSIILDVRSDENERITPENMQAEMLSLGCVSALRLDGGGSSQVSTTAGGFASPIGRKVHHYICFWGDVSNLDTDNDKKEEGKLFKIALDAGHGINTAGKRIPKSLDPNETREWQLNDRICDKIEQLLRGYTGYELLRLDDSDDGADDVALSVRTNNANAWGTDLYLSIHHNAARSDGSTGTWSGIVAYSYPNSSGGEQWRDAFYDALIDATGLKGNRWDGTQTANFHVLRETNAPAVLLEMGFLDSQIDSAQVLSESFAQGAAEAIVEVIALRGNLTKIDAPAAPEAPERLTAFDKAVAAGIVPTAAGAHTAVTWGDLSAALEKLGHLI